MSDKEYNLLNQLKRPNMQRMDGTAEDATRQIPSFSTGALDIRSIAQTGKQLVPMPLNIDPRIKEQLIHANQLGYQINQNTIETSYGNGVWTAYAYHINSHLNYDLIGMASTVIAVQNPYLKAVMLASIVKAMQLSKESTV